MVAKISTVEEALPQHLAGWLAANKFASPEAVAIRLSLLQVLQCLLLSQWLALGGNMCKAKKREL